MHLQALLKATRPNTYPLAIVGVIVGNALAFSRIGNFTPHNWMVFALSLWVALGLQILSNLANDYGDGIKNTDNHRSDRQTAQGKISPTLLKTLIITWAGIIFACGIGLLLIGFNSASEFLAFLGLGIAAIVAAIMYTMGENPYGYQAKSEIAVFIFFGLVNVLGSVYLQSQFIRVSDIIAAIAIGLLCTCVLMVNNMRDIDSDAHAKKHTLAVLLGKEKISHFYRFILLSAYFMIATFGVLRQNYYIPSVILMELPVLKHLKVVRLYADETITPTQLAPQLKHIISITFMTAILMTLSILIFNQNQLF